MKINYKSPPQYFLPMVKAHFSKEDENFILLLEHTEEFEKEIYRIRKDFGIPKKGFTPKLNKGKQWSKIMNNVLEKGGGFGKFMEEIKKLCDEYLLSYHWHYSFGDFVLYNFFWFPTTLTSVGVYSSIRCEFDLKSVHFFEPKGYLLIGIEANINKTDIKKWIDNNWDNEVKPLLSSLPRHPEPRLTITKLYKQISLLKNKMGLTNKKIADKLAEENEDWSFSENEIGIMYKRYMEALKRLKIVKI